MKTPDHELRRWVDAWHDGTISREDGLRLECRLEKDVEAARYFFEMSEIEAALPSAAAGMETRAVEPLRPRFATAPWMKIAAVFAIGLFCGRLLWPHDAHKHTVAKLPEPATPPPSAVITGMLGISWDKGSKPSRIGIPAGAEEVTFASGLMELTFASGTRSVIEGPAGFQILGPNSMSLSYGKVVANVPKGAEGFAIDSRDGRVVDLGTEFAMNMPRSSDPSTLGVFRGEIEFHPRNAQGEILRLQENQALSANVLGGRTIPFHRENFHRELPSREFSWELADAATNKPVEFDVSHLVWKPGRYRMVCKWMSGTGGVVIQGAELLCNGTRISSDEHRGFSGDIHQGPDNIYDFQVHDGVDRAGRWMLRLKLAPKSANPAQTASSRGVVLFEEGMATAATTADFAGVWEYLYNGQTYRRIYHSNGTAEMANIHGGPAKTFLASHWRVQDGCMILDVPEEDGTWVAETHLLRDAKTLIFANQPYQNAKRIGPAPQR